MTLVSRHIAFLEALRGAGLPVSLAEDLDAIAALTGQTVAEARRELGQGIWQDPVSRVWQTRAEYLSGDVRAKLDQARRAAVDIPAVRTYPTSVGLLSGGRG